MTVHPPTTAGRPSDRPGGRPGDRLRLAALAVLAVPGLAGAVLSWESMREAAEPVFGLRLAVLFPALVDALALGAALRWVASVRDGAPIHGWRLAAHAAVGASILLNALAAAHPAQVPWHVTAPAVWSALVELFARDMAGAHRHDHRHEGGARGDRIPARLWLVAPRESARTWLRQARTGQPSAITARIDADRMAAAAAAVRTALPGRRHRRARREILRRLTAGSLPPETIPAMIGWAGSDPSRPEPVGQHAIRFAIRSALLQPGPTRQSTRPDPIGPIPTRSTPIEPGPIEPGPIEPGPIEPGPIEPVAVAVETQPENGQPRARVVPRSGPDRPTRERADCVARPGDVSALRAAITAGALPSRPSLAAVCAHLRIGQGYARATRQALAPPPSEQAPETPPHSDGTTRKEPTERYPIDVSDPSETLDHATSEQSSISTFPSHS